MNTPWIRKELATRGYLSVLEWTEAGPAIGVILWPGKSDKAAFALAPIDDESNAEFVEALIRGAERIRAEFTAIEGGVTDEEADETRHGSRAGWT